MKVSSDCDQDTVRAAYIEIVKTVHPDSGHPDASADKFAEVDNAFRILQAKYAKERRGIREPAEIKEYDIKVSLYTKCEKEINPIQYKLNLLVFTAHSTTTSTIFKLR